jgi:Zn-finger nucleic acid-binding protein
MKNMECPVDRTRLETHTIHAVEIEECPQCFGLWFDEGELNKAKDNVEIDLNWLDFDLWSDQGTLDVAWSSRKCPICDQKMAKLQYPKTGVTIDYCVEKHGIWLDKGEFSAIIESLMQETTDMSLPDYIVASMEEAKEIITGGEGFISEWKDFLTVTRLLQYRVLVDNPKLAEVLVALLSSRPF